MAALALPPAPATAGRSCPLHYRYAPSGFARPAGLACEVLYVVGGLYGNEPALDAVLTLFERESEPKHLLFNGDFHWFDSDPAVFRRVSERVLAFGALRGNVETELAQEPADTDATGCGCGYPDWVGDGVVERSNRILQRLRQTARSCPDLRAPLAALPMWARVDVGALRVGIVHGDAESLAGWGFAQEHLRDAAHRARARSWFEAAQVDAFACSHTCLPVFHTFGRAGQHDGPVVLNNGAAGMPNFRGDPAGLLTRIALRPFAGPERRHGIRRGELHLDAVAIEYDVARWRAQFLAQWPAGSDAHASYWDRISAGPHCRPSAALSRSED